MKYLLELIYLIWVVVSIEGTLGKTVQGREVYSKRENNYSDNDDNDVNYDNDYIESPGNNDLTYNKHTEMSEETNSLPDNYDSNNEDNNESSDSQSVLLSRRSSTNSTLEGENKFSDVDNNDIEQSNEQIIPRSMNNELSDNKTSVQDLAVTNGSSSNEVDHTGHGHADENMQNQGYQKPSVNNNNNNKGENPGRQQQKPQEGNSNNINTNTNTNTNINRSRNKNKNKPSRRNKKKLNNNSNTMEMDKQNSNKKNNLKEQNLNDLTLNNNNNNNVNKNINNNINKNNNPRHTFLLTDKDNTSSELNKSDIQKIITEQVINKLPPDIKNQNWTNALIDKIVAEKLNEMDIDKKNNDDSDDYDTTTKCDDELSKQRDSLLAHINNNCMNNDQSSIDPPAWYYQPPPWYYQPPPLPLSPSLPFTPALPSFPPFPPFPQIPTSYFDCNNGYDNIYYKKFGNNGKSNNYKYDENSKYYINNIDKNRKKHCNCLTPVIEDKPKDYIFAGGIGWLKIHHVPQNWNDARKECIREGAHLAVINSEKEAKLIVNSTYPADQYIFVGIHRYFGNHNWESIFDTPLDNTGFSQWSNNTPAKKGYCGALDRKDGLLTNIDCLAPFSFVCKIPIDGPWKTTCTE